MTKGKTGESRAIFERKINECIHLLEMYGDVDDLKRITMDVELFGKKYYFAKFIFLQEGEPPFIEFHIRCMTEEDRFSVYVYISGTNRLCNTGKEVDGITRGNFRFPFSDYKYHKWNQTELNQRMREKQRIQKQYERMAQKDLNITV